MKMHPILLRNSLYATARAGIFLLVTIGSPGVVAEPRPSVIDPDLEAYSQTIIATFQADFCGDRKLGMDWRQALRGLTKECPSLFWNNKHFLNALTQSEQEFRDLPESERHTPGLLQEHGYTCSSFLSLPEVVETRKRLERYGRGELSASEALQQSCNAAP